MFLLVTLTLLDVFFLGAALLPVEEDFALADGALRGLEVSVEEVAVEEDWRDDAQVNERVPIRRPQRIPTETNHRHHLKPDPTTLIICIARPRARKAHTNSYRLKFAPITETSSSAKLRSNSA